LSRTEAEWRQREAGKAARAQVADHAEMVRKAGAAGIPVPGDLQSGAAKAYAAEHPVLCAHADADGTGSHWLEPGARCAGLGQAAATADLEAGS
jgi:hypothetical protein